ncbi:signal recognition particle-docking protein FtsY [Candidatus Woesearchaeota archaeon]|nr:signal recognition particle-docking protein FtsY [Candidatus Woesearchaeota archaeon]MCF7901677.1 signal recognition particle-docking protein FtsY [Candidatus Woesearchaeota archaeon]MCF8013742.1 signal recognition particle-docking protein FtsY [Candidatus Woesearchaeota archaeon]
MFKFLKEKLNGVVKKFSKEVEEDVEEIKQDDLTEEQKEKIQEQEIQEVKQEQTDIKNEEIQDDEVKEDLEESNEEVTKDTNEDLKENLNEDFDEETNEKEVVDEEKEEKLEESESKFDEKLEEEKIKESKKDIGDINTENKSEINELVEPESKEDLEHESKEETDKTVIGDETINASENKKSKDLEDENKDLHETINVKEENENVQELKEELIEKLDDEKIDNKNVEDSKEKENTQVLDTSNEPEKETSEESEEKNKSEEKLKEEFVDVPEEKSVEKKGFFSKLFKKKPKEEIVDVSEEKEEKSFEESEETDIKKEEIQDDEVKEDLEESNEGVKEEQVIEKVEAPQKKSIFSSVSDTFTKIQLSEEKFENLFWDLEITLLENNVAVEVIDLIKKELKEELTTGKISRKNVVEIIQDTLKRCIDKALTVNSLNIVDEINNSKKEGKPYIISVIGINGAGKTTAIAKLTNYLKNKGFSIVWAASDTFRAAAIQQLEEHANKLDVKMIKHDYDSDPAAVAFDAVKHAKAKNIDVVMIDTAGRMHSNDNLMQELKKLIRVNNPNLKLYVGESITGNDCVQQAKIYDEQIGIDGIILTKVDVDEKGGAPVSITYVTGKPILFLGTGQEYKDIEPFDKQKILDRLGL